MEESYDDPNTDWPSLIAEVLKKQIRDPALPSVVCLSRDQFDHDVNELRIRAREFNWLKLPAVVWYRPQTRWMTKEMAGQASYGACVGPLFEHRWAKAEEFAALLLEKLRRHVRLAAIISAAFDYGFEEGLRRACAKSGIPFLVLYREVGILPRHWESNKNYYKTYTLRPDVKGIAVGGRSASEELIENRVFPSEKVFITGFPRLDPWVDRLQNPVADAARDGIVFLSYADQGYLGGESFREMLLIFASCAERHLASGVRFIVKCKHIADREDVRKLLPPGAERFLDLSIEPVSLVAPRARVVIGYNSLALLESLLAPVRILVPQWGDARRPRDDQTFWREDPEHRKHICFLFDREHFEAEIEAAVDGTVDLDFDMPARIGLLQQYLDFSPGEYATVRLEQFVRRNLTDYLPPR